MNNFLTVVSASVAVVLAIIASLPLLKPNHQLLSWTSPMADLVVRNAKIYTSDESLPFADSMAVRSGRVLQVGNYSSIKDMVGDGTKELDLMGKIVVPGFIDSHVHLISGGLQMARVKLRGISQKDEFVRRVKEAVRNANQGSWILGGGWNNDLWGGELPMASWVDDITPYNPVWLSRMDGHMGLANSVALKLAGITTSSEDPSGGTIVRFTSGEPTGLLIDSAMKLLLISIPEVSVEERREALSRASNHALMRVVTTVVDVGRYFPGTSVKLSWEDFSDVYKWADSSGKMMIRVCLFFPLETWLQLHNLITKVGRTLSQWIYLGGVKAFADGSLGSNSALFYEPYADEPHNYGLQVTDNESLLNLTLASDRVGLQVAIHAIGDRANDLILDMYESVFSTNGVRDRRFRIEHAQHLAPETPARFGKLGIVASVQTGLRRDLICSGHSWLAMDNWHLVPTGLWRINPLGGIKTAMKRIPPGWDIAWIPSETLSLNDALKAYTLSAARACFLDSDLGSLSPGKLADFVILSRDSWDDVAAEGSTSVEATYVGGVQAYP
ncbi:uncharacterized protein Pyn_22603 [Prunus yedoensis var. nudiflora]|uniref:Amidohydrolase 3 domain-containing protein n=1 Tax=Prunus yedoensis var. nudiflora TaxID=2094558 RepID=A0A314ZDK0_PRUYE|nr:uncharacterized protein Pyn_22603 [Prunus yedoensis var. nudiflora]